MDHSAYKEMLSALFDGELRGAEREAALAHLNGCADCRAYFAELAALRAALGDWEEFDAPEGFAAGVMARLRADGATARKTAGRRSPWRGFAALAACAAVVLLAVHALPNAPRMGGGQSIRADSAANTSAAPAAPAGTASAPEEPSAPAYDYAYAGGGETLESARSEEDGAEDGAKTSAAVTNGASHATAGGEAAGGAAVDGEAYAAESTDEPVSIATDDGFPTQPLSRPETYVEDLPVLTLSGEGAAAWLAENGRQGESGAWYADAAALRALPDGLALSDGDLPEDYDGAVLVELREAEP